MYRFISRLWILFHWYIFFVPAPYCFHDYCFITYSETKIFKLYAVNSHFEYAALRILANVYTHVTTIMIKYRTAFSSIQSFSCVWLIVTPWTVSSQASLSITNFQTLLKLISIESVIPFNCLILCRPHLLPPSIFPSIWIFSKESVLCIRWPEC